MLFRSDPAAPFWARPSGLIGLILLYGLVHGVIRFLASDSIGIDDGAEAVFAQTLEWGYQSRQPPLYDWLLNGMQRLAGGAGMGPVLVLKYILLTLSALALWRVARRFSDDPRIAAVAALSLTAIYQVGWNYHEGVTHTALLCASVLGTHLALLRAVEAPGLGRFAALGLVVGLGLLSKHSFYATIAQLSLAALAVPVVRARLRDPRALLVPALALAVYAPYALWLIAGDRSLTEVADTVLRGADRNVAVAALDAAVKPLLFCAPLVVMLALYGRRWLAAPEHAPAVKGGVSADDWIRFHRVAMAAAALGLVLGALFFGLSTIKERHLQAAFIAAPAWLWGELGRRGDGRPPFRRFVQGLAALAALVLILRLVAFAIPDETFCGKKCRPMKPYDALGPAIEATGAAEATLVGLDRFTAGNLRVQAPRARVVSPEVPYAPPATGTAAERCLLVRDRDVTPDDAPEAQSSPGFDAPELLLESGWPHPWRAAGWKVSRFALRPLPAHDPRCRIGL